MTRRYARSGLFIVAFLGILLLLVSVSNYRHMRGAEFNESAEALIQRASLIRDEAGPAYQNEALRALGSNPYNGPFYRLDERLDRAAVRSKITPSQHVDVSDVVFGIEFTEQDTARLVAARGMSMVRREEGVLLVRNGPSDFLRNAESLEIEKEDVGEIVIRLRSVKGKNMKLAWSRETDPTDRWHNNVQIPIIPGNKFQTYVINAKNALKRGLETGGSIRSISFLPSDIEGDEVEIDFIRFISKHSKYMRNGHGVEYETIGREMRHVLYMVPDRTLEYELSVPEGSPTLEFGTAVLIEDAPLSFKITISDDGEEGELFNERGAKAVEWTNVRCDLTRWAGKHVRLSLSVSGSTKNVAFWSNPVVYSEPKKRFNVIVILEDALRADHLSGYGYGLPTSPSKDQMMEECGILFLNALSQATKTRPSVPSIMTSLLPTATGVWNFADMLRDEYLTLAEVLRSQGFATASFIQNGNAGPQAGLHQGFSTLLDQEELGHSTEDAFGEHLQSWLRRNYRRNFLLYIHVIDPHGPYDAPAPYDAWYKESASGDTRMPYDRLLDPEWVETPTMDGRRRLYDGEILHNDKVLSGFFKTLKSFGIYEDTLMVFISDHGEHLGEHGLWEHHPPGYLQGIHVPLMCVYPARFRESKRIPELVQLMDIMPTILELGGIDPSKLLLQGDSLVDLMEGRRLEEWQRRIVVSEEAMDRWRNKPWRNEGLFVFGSLLYRDWHFIASRRFWPKRGYLPEGFRMKSFKFTRDQGEDQPLPRFFFDLLIRYRFMSILNRLQSNNLEAQERWTSESEGGTYRFDPDVLEQLKALGYVG